MKYMGSKRRIAKDILPIILKDRKPGQWYVEPFVGGANMIDKVEGNRIGADINRYLIEALNCIKDCPMVLPKNKSEFGEEDYKALRNDDFYVFKGYAGFAFSYGGKWMGGWRRDKIGTRDYVAESYRDAQKQSPLIQGVHFIRSSYQDLTIPSNSLIYCDPPYAAATKYKDDFNHDDFWQWCREKKKEGHTIFISEYKAPSDFMCVWSKPITSSLTKDTGSKTGWEKLFTL